MAALLHPGVYVQEVPGGARSIEGVPTSTAIFAGETERGPIEPTKIRGAAEYARVFGGHTRHAGASLLKLTMRYAVDLFFQNGGTAAYILRSNTIATNVVNRSVATRDLNFPNPGTPPPTDVLFNDMILAASPGEWGGNVYALIQHRGVDRFRISVFYRPPGVDVSTTNPTFVEDWDQLTLQPADANYVGDVLQRSNYIRWQPDDATPRPPATSRPNSDIASTLNPAELERDPTHPFATTYAATLLGNPLPTADTTAATTSLPAILAALDGIDDAAILVGASARWVNGTGADGFADSVAIKDYYDALRSYADNRPKQDLFLIGDLPAFDGAPLSTVITHFGTMAKTTFAGVYWPHLSVADPVGLTPGSTILIPPSGAVAGVYARTDNRRGVFKAPAGVEAVVGGIVELERNLIDGEQDDLNPIGINAIRPMPSAGIVVWGARTLLPASEWRYVPVRRMAMFLRKSIFNGIQFAVFEPNDTNLWGTLRVTISAFMDTQFRNGAFAGATARDAYFVKVDAETTTPADQAAGVVNILVGFAPLRPAEFVVVRLSQKTASG